MWMYIFILSLILPLVAAPPCEVGGISDSPQGLTCAFRDKGGPQGLRLRCQQGQYVLIWQQKAWPVEATFHEDVEAGDCPLNFMSSGLHLRVDGLQATLNTGGRMLPGKCRP